MRTLLVAATVFIIASSAAGCESVGDSCQTVCDKVVGCAKPNKPKDVADCQKACLEDTAVEVECVEAVRDMSSCIANVVCTDVLNEVACTEELEVVEDLCPAARRSFSPISP